MRQAENKTRLFEQNRPMDVNNKQFLHKTKDTTMYWKTSDNPVHGVP